MGSEDWIDMKLANICCDVEEERKPADPVEELNLAYFANLWRETTCGPVDLLEESNDSQFLRWWRAIMSWVTLGNEDTGDEDGPAHGNAGDDTKHFELCVPKERQYLWQVNVSREVT